MGRSLAQATNEPLPILFEGMDVAVHRRRDVVDRDEEPPSMSDRTTRSATRSRNEYRRGTPGRPPVPCTDGSTSPIWSQ